MELVLKEYQETFNHYGPSKALSVLQGRIHEGCRMVTTKEIDGVPSGSEGNVLAVMNGVGGIGISLIFQLDVCLPGWPYRTVVISGPFGKMMPLATETSMEFIE